MNYFEQELRKLTKFCEDIRNPVFVGRTCYADLGDDIRIKLEFVTTGHADHYVAIRAAILNRVEGQVDVSLFRFKDIWGEKTYGNSRMVPYIWVYNQEVDWYGYHPTDADFRKLAAEVNAYAGVFAAHEKAAERTEPESVVKKIRESKQNPAPVKNKTNRKKTEPEL